MHHKNKHDLPGYHIHGQGVCANGSTPTTDGTGYGASIDGSLPCDVNPTPPDPEKQWAYADENAASLNPFRDADEDVERGMQIQPPPA